MAQIQRSAWTPQIAAMFYSLKNHPALANALVAILVLTLFYTMVYALSPHNTLDGFLHGLFLWDSHIRQSIAELGYQFEYEIGDPRCTWETNNIVYPPLYPLLSSLVQRAFDLPWDQAAAGVSQMATLVALYCWVAIVRQLQLHWIWVVFSLTGLFAFPGSVWLIAAYTDGVSLALALALLHVTLGISRTQSRIQGFMLFLLGLLLGLNHFRTSVLAGASVVICLSWWWRGDLAGKSLKEHLKILRFSVYPLVGVVLGWASFFTFCYLKFGMWDAYQQTIFGVWGHNNPNFLQVFDFTIYDWFAPSFAQDRFGQSTPYLGRFLASWFLTLSLTVLVAEFVRGRLRSGTWWRLDLSPGIWLLALSLFVQYFLISMRVPNLFPEYPMPSVRYLIPCAVLLSLYIAQGAAWLVRESRLSAREDWLLGAVPAVALLGIAAWVQPIILALFFQRILQG